MRAVSAARWGWPAFAAAALALSIAAVPGYVRDQLTPAVRAALPTHHLTTSGYTAWLVAESTGAALVFLAVATVVYLRAAHEAMALFCAYTLVGFGLGVVGPLAGLRAPQAWQAGAAVVVYATGQVALGTFFAVFPTGRFDPRWLRWVALAGTVVIAVATVSALATGADPTTGPIPAVGVLLCALTAGTQVRRYRRSSSSQAQAQTIWVVYGIASSIVLFGATRAAAILLPAHTRDDPVFTTLVGGGAIDLALAVIPVCIGIAVLRTRLWDIDRVVNRTLLYGGLTLSVIAIYVLVVGYLGTLLRTETTLWMSLAATGMVAVLIQPLRLRLQRAVNRLTYGMRDEPYAIVAALGQRLDAAASTGSVLPAAVETIATALKLPYAAIELRDGGATFGAPTERVVEVPLRYQGELVGRLLLAPRRADETLTAADQRLVADLARQIGTIAHAVTLTADLQRSRERIVAAREEERRRLRRDLHDGLGPTLAGLALKASTISDVAPGDPAEAGRIGEALYAGIRATIADVRRLVYQLRPPTLDELGLVGALQGAAAALCRPGRLDVQVIAPAPLPALPAAVEVAAYRIASEAMANVDRHAEATTCAVTLTVDATALEVTVIDDGHGIPADRPAGVGLIAMRERTAELGGTLSINGSPGTTIIARIPLPSAVEA